jgi:hypothetical protein
VVAGQLEVEPRQHRDVVAGRGAHDEAVADGRGPRRRLPEGVGLLEPEAEPEPPVDRGRLARGQQHVVGGAALVDPPGGGRGVQLAGGLRALVVGGGVAGRVDEDVLAPRGTAPGRTQQEPDRLPAARGDRARGVSRGQDRSDLRPGGAGVVVLRGEERVDRPVPAVPRREEPAGVGQVGLGEGVRLEPGHDRLLVLSGAAAPASWCRRRPTRSPCCRGAARPRSGGRCRGRGRCPDRPPWW